MHMPSPGRCPGLWATYGLTARLNYFMLHDFINKGRDLHLFLFMKTPQLLPYMKLGCRAFPLLLQMKKHTAMTRFFFFLISLFACSCSLAQKEVALDEAIQMAIGNSPRLKGAALYADKAKAAKGENWDGGNLQIGYSWGQLDGLERSDNELTIEQSLGNLLTPYYKNALLKTQAAEGQQRMALIK